LKKIGIVPAYNEERTITKVLSDLMAVVDYIIVINDGSTDDTETNVLSWSKENPGFDLCLITLKKNMGMAKALKVAFAKISTSLKNKEIGPDDLVVTFDADDQFDARQIDKLIAYMNEHDLDAILAQRNFSKYPVFKRAGNKVMSLWASLLSGYYYRDVECGLRILKVHTVPKFLKYLTGVRYSHSQEMGIIIPRLGYKKSNEPFVNINYYRSRTHLKDALINPAMALIALIKVTLKLEQTEIWEMKEIKKICASQGKTIKPPRLP